MSVLNVALIGSDEFARSLGKKGDSRDIDSYVHKESKDGGVRVLSLLRPLKHPAVSYTHLTLPTIYSV